MFPIKNYKQFESKSNVKSFILLGNFLVILEEEGDEEEEQEQEEVKLRAHTFCLLRALVSSSIKV
jgi:hypothetical protein